MMLVEEIKNGERRSALESLTRDQPSKPLRVWLADDHAPLLHVIAETLSQDSRLQCARQFSSAEKLLAALATEQERLPDIVLLDFNMRGMSGAEAIPFIRDIAPCARAFIMTAFHDSLKRSRAAEAGADGFFVKSSDWERNIERMIESARLPITVRDASKSEKHEVAETKESARETANAQTAGFQFTRALNFVRSLVSRQSCVTVGGRR